MLTCSATLVSKIFGTQFSLSLLATPPHWLSKNCLYICLPSIKVKIKLLPGQYCKESAITGDPFPKGQVVISSCSCVVKKFCHGISQKYLLKSTSAYTDISSTPVWGQQTMWFTCGSKSNMQAATMSESPVALLHYLSRTKHLQLQAQNSTVICTLKYTRWFCGQKVQVPLASCLIDTISHSSASPHTRYSVGAAFRLGDDLSVVAWWMAVQGDFKFTQINSDCFSD